MDFSAIGVPTRFHFGEDCLEHLAEEVAGFPGELLLVAGKTGAAKSGALKIVEETLRNAKRSYAIFSEIEANPNKKTVDRCAEMFRAANVSCVIAIGGGSVMDAGKAICYALKGVNYLAASQDTPTPLITVVTASGTGSEITPYSILTVDERQTKVGIPCKKFPDASFIKASFLGSLPHQQLISMYFDIICHAMESSLSVKRTPVQTHHAMNALTHLKAARSILSGNTTLPMLELMAKASIEAGASITLAGTSIPHGMSYPITYFFGVPHGLACAAFLPAYLAYCNQDNVGALLNALGIASVEELGELVHKFVSKVELTQEQKDKFTTALFESGKTAAHGEIARDAIMALW